MYIEQEEKTFGIFKVREGEKERDDEVVECLRENDDGLERRDIFHERSQGEIALCALKVIIRSAKVRSIYQQ